MANRHFEFFDGLDFQFVHDEKDIIHEGFHERLSKLEEEFNAHIDECVDWGTYSPQEAEEYKQAHHKTLWAAHLAIEHREGLPPVLGDT